MFTTLSKLKDISGGGRYDIDLAKLKNVVVENVDSLLVNPHMETEIERFK